MSNQTKKARLLFAIAGVAILVFALSIVLHQRHYTFDPYTWADPRVESDISRSQWLRRRHLYWGVGIVSFAAAIASVWAALVIRRRERLKPYQTR
jgi:hypothetical protein